MKYQLHEVKNPLNDKVMCWIIVDVFTGKVEEQIPSFITDKFKVHPTLPQKIINIINECADIELDARRFISVFLKRIV